MRLLLGGSPCTHWSIAQSKNRETEPSGIGWELFKNYLIAVNRFKPDYFLYENNKSMSPAIRDQVTKELGVEPIMINSALVSAQSRKRLYWTNIPDVKQPDDKGIALRDILQDGVIENEYTLKPLSKREMAYMVREVSDGRNHFDFEYFHDGNKDKSSCITANTYRGVPYNVLAEPIRIGTIENASKNVAFDSQQYRVYSPDGKSVTLCGQGGGVGAKTGLYATPSTNGHYDVSNGEITIDGATYPIRLADGHYVIRKLTVAECKRLQTVPEEYAFPVSDTQAYKMLGNGWTIDVIAHILPHIDGIRKNEIDVLSLYDGMSCGQIALDKLGANITRYRAMEIDKYAIKTTMANFPNTIQMGDAFGIKDWSR